MQKKIIALAIAGLASSAVFAQSNVTIYGRVDYGFMSRGNNDGAYQAANGRKQEFASGMAAGSRIGFRGNEDLGNGNKVIFQLEYGIGNDATGTNAAGSSAATWVNRNSWIGLTGNWGTVVGGRVDGDRYGVFNKYDAFGGGGMGNFTQMTFQVDRGNNAVVYLSPTFAGGFSVWAGYSNALVGNEVNGVAGGIDANDTDLRLGLIRLNYDNGPISAVANYEGFSSSDNVFDGKTWQIAGSYDFGVVKLSALYDRFSNSEAVAPVNFRDWFVSAKIPVGKFTIKTTYGRVRHSGSEDGVSVCGNDCKSSKFGLGVDYAVSKRTTLYADYGHISNGKYTGYASAVGQAGVSISPAANSQASSTGGALGYGTSGFNIGVGHNF